MTLGSSCRLGGGGGGREGGREGGKRRWGKRRTETRWEREREKDMKLSLLCNCTKLTPPPLHTLVLSSLPLHSHITTPPLHTLVLSSLPLHSHMKWKKGTWRNQPTMSLNFEPPTGGLAPWSNQRGRGLYPWG